MHGSERRGRRTFSPELELALAACRWPVAPDAVRVAADAPIDWQIFRTLLDRHGIVALVGNALRIAGVELPPDHAEPLDRDVLANTRHSLLVASETASWAQLLERKGIAACFLKGPTIAQLAYANLALKRSGDIDILVVPDRVAQVHDLLAHEGLAPLPPYSSDGAVLARYWRWGKEVTYGNRNGIAIDLHVRVAQNRRILPTIDAHSPGQDVTIGGVAVPTLADPLLYPYLCYHGAVHSWSRLKWLADFGAFLHGRDATALHAAAVELGVGKASRIALHLCNDLLGTGTPLPTLTPTEHLHTRIARASIAHSLGGSDVERLSPVALAQVASHLTIGAGLRGTGGALAAQWMQPIVRASYPDRRAAMFHLLRIPRFLGSLVRSRKPRDTRPGR